MDRAELSSKFGMFCLKMKGKSPSIMFGLGMVAMGAAVVSAVCAGRKHDAVMQDHLDRLDAAKAEIMYPEECEDSLVDEETGEIKQVQPIVRTEAEIKKAVRHEYFVTFLNVGKLYGPTAALTLIAGGLFTKAHVDQKNMITGLTAAYTGLQGYIKQYEENNIKLNGEESHRMCKYGFKEVEEEVEDPETGEKKVIKKNVPLDNAEDVKASKNTFHDQFIRFAKGLSPVYSGIANDDKVTLQNAERILKDIYYSRGWVVVNDFRALLHMDLTKEGMVEGWVKGCGPEPSIGLEDSINNRFLARYNGEDVFLTLNIHGNVYALLSEKERREKEALIRNLNKDVGSIGAQLGV